MRTTLVAALSVLLFGCGADRETPQISFIALGDAPYGDPADVFPPFRALIGEINEAAPPLVIHVGDTHGRYTCSDELLADIRGLMNAIDAPLLYTPGDNEWTDCGRTEVGEFEPLERLDHIRATYFAEDRTLGAAPAPVETQRARGYPENARLMIDGVAFITAHVVGSNNNFNPDEPSAVEEFMARNEANEAWLRESFAALGEADAFVVALHAEMFIPQSGFGNGWWSWSPFRVMGVTLGQLSSEHEKPVLLLYGDSHQHKAFQPFPDHRPFLHAIEVYGHPDIKAIEIAVRPGADEPFRVSRTLSP